MPALIKPSISINDSPETGRPMYSRNRHIIIAAEPYSLTKFKNSSLIAMFFSPSVEISTIK
jgi:hypothetical protein